MLWNKNALLQAGGWSSEFQSHQEYELLFRILKTGHTIAFADASETIVRQRISGSITHKTKQTRAKEGILLREEIWKYLVEQSLDNPERKNAFLQYTFRQLRGLYRNDPEFAMIIFRNYFTGIKFVPEKNTIPFYNLIYKTFGFRGTERLFHIYSSVRDKYLPFLPKNN